MTSLHIFYEQLAQKMENILPLTVSVVKNAPIAKDKLDCAENELVYVLINAIKELHATNASLNARLSALEEMISPGRAQAGKLSIAKNNRNETGSGIENRVEKGS